jgi:hypothetical protein
MGQTIEQKAVNNGVLSVRLANETFGTLEKKGALVELFGEFWHEGGLAVLFGEAGSGRSALALQIADSIARGRPVKPFERAAKPQKVLLLDLAASDRSFHERYSSTTSKGTKHYRFSERLMRVSVSDPAALQSGLSEHLEPVIRETGASVLVIDSVASLMRTAVGGRDLIALMHDLHRLRVKLNLSILLVAGRKERASASCRITDLQDWRILSNAADSIFAIGRSGRDSGERFIKQVKSRTGEVVYDEENVPVFRLKKIDGKFLGFEFIEWGEESELSRRRDPHSYDPQLVESLKTLSESSMPIRAIADKMKIPRSTVHRILKHANCQREVELPPWAPVDLDPPSVSYDDEPETPSIYANDDPESMRLRRVSYLASLERAGQKPVDQQEQDRLVKELMNDGVDREDEKPKPVANPFPGTQPRLNAYGKTIYVETEDSLHRPTLWYFLDAEGGRKRAVRKLHGIFIENLPENYSHAPSPG